MASIPVVRMAGTGFQIGLCRTWRWTRILGLVYLAGCALYLLFTLQAFTGALPEIKVPMVVGVEQARATGDLEQLGFIVHVDAIEPADGFPAGAVMYQSLQPDSHVRTGRNIYLIICQGPAHVVLPDLRQSANYDAMRALAQLGLQPSIATTAHSSTIAFDSVIEQIPAPGTRVEVGSAVALIISDGPPDDNSGSDAAASGDTSSGDSGPAPKIHHHVPPPDKDPSKNDPDPSKIKDTLPGGPGQDAAPAVDPNMPDIPPMPNIDSEGNIIEPTGPPAGTHGNAIPGDTTPVPPNGSAGASSLSPTPPASHTGSHPKGGRHHTPVAPHRTPAAPPGDPSGMEPLPPIDTAPLPMTPADTGVPR